MLYTVYNDDVFHLYETEYRTISGTFATYKEAVDYCQRFAKKYVSSFGSEDELRMDYSHYGEDLWITPEPKGKHFSSRDYMNKCIKQRKDFV